MGLFNVDGLGDLLGEYVKVGAEVAKDNLVYNQSTRARDARKSANKVENRAEYQISLNSDEPPPSALSNARTFASGNYMLIGGVLLAGGLILYTLTKRR